jgi:hypothetical protein
LGWQSAPHKGEWGLGYSYEGEYGRGWGYGEEAFRGAGLVIRDRRSGWERRRHGGRYAEGYGEEDVWPGREFHPARYAGDFPQGTSAGQPGSARHEMAGPFVGRGPRNYRRSDGRIYEEVCEILTLHGGIDASDIAVSVSDGEVTLAGSIDSLQTKRLVEDVIAGVPGVRDIQNQLRVVISRQPSAIPDSRLLTPTLSPGPRPQSPEPSPK